MIKIGMIGLNSGNGHPISYSSIFNGYNEYYLKKYSKFKLINEYLPRDHKNLKSNIIKGAKITHIWTQKKSLSEKISKICKIPNISPSLKQMSKSVDAVILARDDYKQHLKIIKIFIEKSIPIFIDKLIVGNEEEWKEFSKISKKTIYMSCSSARYTRDLEKLVKNKKKFLKNVVFGVGSSKENWARYSHHILEGLIKIFGKNISYVKYISGNKDKEVYEISYPKYKFYFLFHKKLSLPIELKFYNFSSNHFSLPYIDYFYSIKKMMNEFYKMIKMKKQIISKDDMNFISKTVLAGIISKKKNGICISPNNLKKIWENLF